MFCMSILFVVFAIFCQSIPSKSEGSISHPGKAIFWSPSTKESKTTPEYLTQSIDIRKLGSLLDAKAQNFEVVVYFRSHAETRELFNNKQVRRAILQSESSTVLPYVYFSSETDFADSSVVLKESKKVSADGLLEMLETEDSSFSNGRIDAFEVTLSGNNEIDYNLISEISRNAAELSASKGATILFVVVEEPIISSSSTMGDMTTSTVSEAHFSRVLASSISSLNTDGLYYKPEGCEYAMYYAATYLYITPDIFTGLFTGIFMFFVCLTGYTCMGSIQGNSTFPNKMPVVGKEA